MGWRVPASGAELAVQRNRTAEPALGRVRLLRARPPRPLGKIGVMPGGIAQLAYPVMVFSCALILIF